MGPMRFELIWGCGWSRNAPGRCGAGDENLRSELSAIKTAFDAAQNPWRAFSWGVLDRMLEDETIEIGGVAGTSAGR